MLDRDTIINCLREFSIGKDYVHAMWLEGADGVDKVDEYSDIDFWFDVDKDHQESFLWECIDKLNELGNIDSQVNDIGVEIAQSNIHLENTSEYLTLDVCVQSHDIRGLGVTCYVRNDIAELPLVIFDKDNIITYRDYEVNLDEIRTVLENNKSRILQMSRVDKYIKRGNYLESYMKYIENIANPLVRIARLIYTPRHYEYMLCHISDHLPAEVVRELESFYKVKSLEEIESNLSVDKQLLEKYEQEIKHKYNL